LELSRVFWDTNLFIYLVEGHGELSEAVRRMRERMIEREDQLCTSTLTLGEVLVRPLSAGRRDLAQRYESLIAPPGALVLFFDRACAVIYARIRQDKGIRAPDAMQLACAAQAHCDLFITNDDRLSRKVVPGIDFITSLERAFL